MVLVPAQRLRRVGMKAHSGDPRSWFFDGIPQASVYVNEQQIVCAVHFRLPIDVPSAPRTTGKSLWTKASRSWWAWKRCMLAGVEFALLAAGWEHRLPERIDQVAFHNVAGRKGRRYRFEGEAIFDHALDLEPKKGKRPMAPLWVSARIRTALQGDWDNRAKSVLDMGNGYLWRDDARVSGGSFVVMPTQGKPAYVDIFAQYLPIARREAMMDAVQWGHLDLENDYTLLPGSDLVDPRVSYPTPDTALGVEE